MWKVYNPAWGAYVVPRAGFFIAHCTHCVGVLMRRPLTLSASGRSGLSVPVYASCCIPPSAGGTGFVGCVIVQQYQKQSPLSEGILTLTMVFITDRVDECGRRG